MALAIDAMDWLHSGRIDGICLVTSDSDFAPLALRVKEEGLKAYGFGRQNTPKSFVNAVHRFFYLETLMASTNELQKAPQDGATSLITAESVLPGPAVGPSAHAAIMRWDAMETALVSAVEALSMDSGWAKLADVGNLMVKRFPDFSPRNYSCTKLSMVVERCARLQTRRNGQTVFLRVKKPTPLGPPAQKPQEPHDPAPFLDEPTTVAAAGVGEDLSVIVEGRPSLQAHPQRSPGSSSELPFVRPPVVR